VDDVYGVGNLARARIPDPAREFAARRDARRNNKNREGWGRAWELG